MQILADVAVLALVETGEARTLGDRAGFFGCEGHARI